MNLLVSTDCKDIYLKNDNLIIFHFLKREFDCSIKIPFRKSREHYKIFQSNKIYDKYLSMTLDSYKKSKVFDSKLEICNIDNYKNLLGNYSKDEVIITKCTKYGDNLLKVLSTNQIPFEKIMENVTVQE